MVRSGTIFSNIMKKVLLQFTLIGVSTALLAGVARAQDDTSPTARPGVTTPASRGESASTNVISKPTGASSHAASSTSHVMASRMIGSKVKSSTGESVGQIDDVLIDQNGQIRFAVLGVGGFLGIGEKKTPVPWQALQPTATHDFTLNIDRQKLKNAPTIDKNQMASEWATPSFTSQVYAHYGMQEPSAVGGTATESLKETGRDAKEGAKDLGQDIKDTGKDLKQDVERGAEKTKDRLEDK